MYFWWIALKDIQLYIRDRRALLLTIAMPLILIAILGAAFSNMFQDDSDQTFTPIKMGIVNLDEGSLGKTLAEDIFGHELREVLHVHYVDEATLRELLREQKMEMGLTISSDFTANLLNGEIGRVDFYTENATQFKVGIISSIVSQFGQTVQVHQKAGELRFQQLVRDPAYHNIPIQKVIDQVTTEIAKQISLLDEQASYISEQGIYGTNKVISSFQYYAVGMGVMFLLIAVVNAVGAIIEEKEDPVMDRLLITNMRHTDYLLGKLIGLLVKCGLQMAVIILGTHYIFGVEWGDSGIGIFYIGFSYVVGASGLGVFLGSMIHKSKTLESAGMIMVQIMAALGGSMIPLYIYPDWLIQAAKILPNALALQSFMDLMTGEQFEGVWVSGAILLSVGALFLLLGWLKLRSEGKVKYA